MLWIGAIIVVLAFVAVIKQWEVRATLFGAGLLMCVLSGHPLTAFDSFSKMLVSSWLVPIIACAMGFAQVITLTECEVKKRSHSRPMSQLKALPLPLPEKYRHELRPG